MNWRTRLARLEKVVIDRTPPGRMTLMFARVGSSMAEGRGPGVYGFDGLDADVVYDGTEPDARLVEFARQRLGPNALIAMMDQSNV